MYQKGALVPKDNVLAYVWYSVLATRNDDAKNRRDDIATRMSKTEIQHAKDIARAKLAKIAELTPEPIKEEQAVREETQSKAMADAPTSTSNTTAAAHTIPMLQQGGTYVVPVTINDVITLNFVVDSGAADVSIPQDVVSTLIRTQTITAADFLGTRSYKLADGSIVPSETFRIKSLQVGTAKANNVIGSVVNEGGALLLGQSFLSKFRSVSVDNSKHLLKLE